MRKVRLKWTINDQIFDMGMEVLTDHGIKNRILGMKQEIQINYG